DIDEACRVRQWHSRPDRLRQAGRPGNPAWGVPVPSTLIERGHRRTSERPGEQDVRRAIRGPCEPDQVRGELADPGLLLARQEAELLLDEVDPAPSHRVDVVIGDPGDGVDPRRV